MNHTTVIDAIIAATKLPQRKDVVSALMELLGLSQSAVYNRLNHSSKFTFEEVALIAKAYKISLDEYVYEGSLDEMPHPFYNDALRSMPRTFLDYIRNIQSHLLRLSQLPDLKVTIMVNEFSLLHLLPYDHITYSKLFMWNMANWNKGETFDRYDPALLIKDEAYQAAKKAILDIFQQKATVEIWTPNMMTNLVSNVKYILDAKLMNSHDANEIKQELIALSKDIEVQLNTGQKVVQGKTSTAGTTSVYINENIISSEKIYVASDYGDFVFSMYDVPNYLRTTSSAICKHTKSWMNRVKHQSTEITHSSKLKRMALIQKMKNEVDGL